jgi:hypothetical protein
MSQMYVCKKNMRPNALKLNWQIREFESGEMLSDW